MWIFTKHGFFSAVCAQQGDGSQKRPLDPERIMVRARVKAHLDALREAFSQHLGESQIKETIGTDYAFRLLLSKSAWAQILKELAEEIDYGNFKSEVADFQGDAGADYEQSLHKVWSVMYRLQD